MFGVLFVCLWCLCFCLVLPTFNVCVGVVQRWVVCFCLNGYCVILLCLFCLIRMVSCCVFVFVCSCLVVGFCVLVFFCVFVLCAFVFLFDRVCVCVLFLRLCVCCFCCCCCPFDVLFAYFSCACF